jgi:F-type H+-transporting ATPase subunit b
MVLSASVFLFFGAVACAAAPEKGEHKAGGHHSKNTQFKVVSHGPGLEEERTLDLSKPEDRARLNQLFDEGTIDEVVAVQPTSLLFQQLQWEVGLWTVVVFILLFLILKSKAWGPMLEGLQKREENIHEALADAQKARDEAKAMRDGLQKQLDQAGEQVRGMLDEARRAAQTTTDEMIAKARTEISTERDRLHREIGLARDQALQELWNQTAQLATLASAKAIRRQLGADDHRRLVDEAVAELRSTATELRQEVWGPRT